jgi:hypothetical protein
MNLYLKDIEENKTLYNVKRRRLQVVFQCFRSQAKKTKNQKQKQKRKQKQKQKQKRNKNKEKSKTETKTENRFILIFSNQFYSWSSNAWMSLNEVKVSFGQQDEGRK